MMRLVRKHGSSVLAILGLMVIGLATAGYITQKQRLRIPIIEPEPVRMKVELSNANAVTPGQGQTVQVAGVQIGRIGEVELEDGYAIVNLEIEPEYDDVIHTDASALLRPRTNLKDMYIQVFPGSPDKPLADEGFTIPLRNTLTDIDLHEILAELNPRTQEYLRLFAHGTGRGLKDNGEELAEVLKRFGPTMRDLARVNRSVARERVALRRLVTSLADLNGRLARDPQDLTELVDTAAATFGAFASEDDDLRATVSELAPTLRQATTTLRDLRPFAQELGPASRALIPVFRQLDETNAGVQPFAREAAPIIRERIRPFVRAARPLTADLRVAAEGLGPSFPELRRSARVVNRFFNMLGHNPDGREGPSQPNREEGFLFWLAWLGHQSVHLVNVEDANGPMRPVFLTGTCGTLTSLVIGEPELEFGLNLSPVLATLCGDPQTPSIDLEGVLEQLPDLPEAPEIP